MILQLLAGDPRTHPDTLTLLAGHPTLTLGAAVTLAVHPNLPGDVPMRVPDRGGALLAMALTRPDLPPGRRAQLIADDPDLSAHIGAGAPLTGAEISAHYRTHPPVTRTALISYATHPHTPTALALTAIADATALGAADAPDDPYAGLLLEAAGVRHRAPTTDRARRAVATTDPDATYARELAAFAVTDAPNDWRPTVALVAHPHPHLIAALLTAAAADTRTEETGSLATALFHATTIPDRDRFTALTLTEAVHSGRRHRIVRTAPDDLILAIATTYNARLIALTNPNASPHTLAALHRELTDTAHSYRRWRPEVHLEPDPCATLTTHPAISAHLRTRLLAHTGHTHPLGRHLDAGVTPDNLLDIPVPDLLAPTSHAHGAHWAALAYSGYAPAPAITPDQAQALLALEGHFPGTLRELLETARALTP